MLLRLKADLKGSVLILDLKEEIQAESIIIN